MHGNSLNKKSALSNLALSCLFTQRVIEELKGRIQVCAERIDSALAYEARVLNTAGAMTRATPHPKELEFDNQVHVENPMGI